MSEQQGARGSTYVVKRNRELQRAKISTKGNIRTFFLKVGPVRIVILNARRREKMR
jgi:hypothetical protein